LAEAQTRVALPPPPDPAAGWETCAASRLEWDAQAAAPIDLLFLAYARCCASHREPVLAEDQLRAGHFDGKEFTEAPGDSLIQERAIDAAIQEYVLHEYKVQTFRLSPSILGAGFIEAISSQTLADIASDQPSLFEGALPANGKHSHRSQRGGV
jgi:hypothetical protein